MWISVTRTEQNLLNKSYQCSLKGAGPQRIAKCNPQ